MKIWSSAAWPCHDGIELDLIAAAWVEPVQAGSGHKTLRLTELGIRCVAEARRRNQRALSPHDALAARMARELLLGGRIVWRELPLRARALAPSPEGESEPASEPKAAGASDDAAFSLEAMQAPAGSKPAWRVARPDIFSVRNTSVEDYLQPVVHEIKVSRADLLSDLRHAAKRDAYQWLCSECFYVFPAGVAEAAEVPEEFGVWVLHGAVEDGRLELLRPARHKSCKLPFSVWLALAKAAPVRLEEESAQAQLAAGADAADLDADADADAAK
ncbi:MAG: hypothetical protein IV107_20880 [Paucibacter sp.]|nr:hypothetical protein [Roseateles sp.]